MTYEITWKRIPPATNDEYTDAAKALIDFCASHPNGAENYCEGCPFLVVEQNYTRRIKRCLIGHPRSGWKLKDTETGHS